MRVRIVLLSLAVAAAGAARAADIEFPAPEAPGPAEADWSGPYLGLALGYGWLRDVDYSFAPPLRSSGQDVVFGGHAGYLRQFGAFALGVEGEFTRLDINFEGFPVDAENSIALKARGGFAFDRVLASGHVGAVYATTNIGLEDWGWVAGGGLDYLITDNVVAGVSYDHMRFDRFDGTLIDASLDIVKARLSLKF